MKKEKIGNIARFINGVAFKPDDWENTGYKIIRIQNLTDRNKAFNRTNRIVDNKYIVKKGDVLVSWSATIEVFLWDDEDALLNQHIFKVEFDYSKVIKEYFIFALQTTIRDLTKFAHGSTMKHIVKSDFDNHIIPLPSISEQKYIAKVLNQVEALINQRKQSIALLDKYLKSTFSEMFGDPTRNQKKIKIGKIRDLLIEAKYGTSKPSEDSGKIPYLRMNNITYEGYMDYSNLKYINLDLVEKEKYIVKKGDILFNRTNSKELVGKTGVYNRDYEMAIAGYLIKLRVNEKSNPWFIWGYLNSKHGKETLFGMCKSIVGMANINAQELQSIKILIPPIQAQNQFAQIVEKTENLKEQYKKHLKELENMYGVLSQKAFKGELNIK